LAAIAGLDITNAYTGDFRDSRARVVQKEKQQVIPSPCPGFVLRPKKRGDFGTGDEAYHSAGVSLAANGQYPAC
jgi:hypothetical protein